MSSIAIRVANLSKLYHIGRGQGKAGYRTLRESMMDWAKVPLRWFSRDGREAADDTIWALKDVSFEVKRGEVVGIIGRNGAGKSTLLKILSRITDPTEGTVDLYGRVGSLLEVGTGFHPELTGRENIYLNGAILGMKKAEIERKFDEIVEFSEIEKFLDTPVKHYSSGMYVRLAFAVAAHLDPEILLVDEVLAVGDAEFQKKCLGKMGEVARLGKTILFVSHNMGAISKLCENAILLNSGKIIEIGDVSFVLNKYLQTSVQVNGNIGYRNDKNCFYSIRTVNVSGEPATKFLYEETIYIEFSYYLTENLKGLYLTFSLSTGSGFKIMFVDIQESAIYSSFPNTKGVHSVIAEIPGSTLAQGEYFITAGLSMKHSGALDIKKDFVRFEIVKLNSFRDESNRPPLCLNINWTIPSG